MAQDGTQRNRRSRDGLGDIALTCGVVAMVFALVPIVGDFVAVTAAVAAVSLCLIGLIREHRGLATYSRLALSGGLFGLIAAFITVVTISATWTLG